MKAIVNGTILTPQGEVKGTLLFDERIQAITTDPDVQADEVIDAKGMYVAPGLVDLHIHGYLGEDASDGSEEGIRIMAKGLLKNGVTSFLPTTMTVSWPEIEAALDNIRKLKPESQQASFDGSEILGCHAEGPFINPERKGAQAADNILAPDADKVIPHKDIIKLLTMAPEMPGGMEFIKKVTAETDIVISIGHTSATYEQAMAAIEAGASHMTHTFNAMTPLTHRAPGVVGAALMSDATCELIADNFHIHPALFNLLHRMKGDKLVLITDCTRAGGLEDGEYTLGGQPIFVQGIECRLADGTIAGSVLKLNNAVKNYRDGTGIPLYEAVNAATLNAARDIGVDDTKGSLEQGKDADIILMDKDCQVHATIVRGTVKYKKEA
ncbi:MAG: N-acetylglucosamine-6-phosphate deacetylase [Christensenellales bacterium]|jgi:N-acetylglucosamine-6-phosphate deacetylase